MDLESFVRAYVVIKPEEDENGMRRYKRLDIGRIIPSQGIEFLQEPSGLIAHDGESKTNVVIPIRNSNIKMNANAIILGEKLLPQNIYSYSFCKARL